MGFDSTISHLVHRTPAANWRKEVDELLKTLPSNDLRALEMAMHDDIARLAFLSEYIAKRSAKPFPPSLFCQPEKSKEEHDSAAKSANNLCKKVNNALGYDYPDRDCFNV